MKRLFIKYIGVFIILLFANCSNDKVDLAEDDEINSSTEETTSSEEDETASDETTSTEKSKPNIVLIIADDMGLDASPGYEIGSIKPNMPNLQHMIDTGVSFSNVWSNPTCAPTRAGILTGKYGLNNGVVKVGDELSTTEVSLQKYIDEKTDTSYAHAVIGKWHLSNTPSHPNDMGVDYFAGFLRGTVPSYTNWDLVINGNEESSAEYTTTKFTDLAIDWTQAQTKPWFLWLAYNAPHTPFHLPPANLHYQGDLPSDQASIDANPTPYYMAMLEAMDTEYGRFLDAMSDDKKANTIFIFIGDNGTPRNVIQEFGRNKAKETIYQGGINVPMVVSGKGVTRFNAQEDALVNTTDLFATIADIAGSNTSEINDSKSFNSLLTQTGTSNRDYNYSEIETDNGNSDYTISNKTYKYLMFADGTEAMYNIAIDPLEETNLLNSSGEVLNSDDTGVLQNLKTAVVAIRQY